MGTTWWSQTQTYAINTKDITIFSSFPLPVSICPRTPSGHSPYPRLGGKSAVILFVVTLVAFVVESQLTQYVQSTLHFRQPFFLFYVVHSSFALTFPLHLLYLVLTTSASLESILAGLSLAVKIHFAPSDQSPVATLRSPFPYVLLFRLSAFLTLGLTLPSLLWFVSVSLSPLSDVTAIWNTNAFFAYIITVRLFKLNWELRKLVAVLVATFGVLAVVYGDAKQPEPPIDHRKDLELRTETDKPKAPLVGDLLTLFASIGYGLYQVMYKRYAALPSDPEFDTGSTYIPLPGSDGIPAGELSEDDMKLDDSVYPPSFGLHPNLLACGIGLMTLLSLWIMLPLLHYSGYERFRLPDSPIAVLSIAGIAGSGLVFNAGILTLLGIWGPIVVSVGNLLTIVLVLLSDVTVGQGMDVITPWNLAGSGGIVVAFGILAYDMVQHPRSHN
ncbi:hypothetical protein F5148DRAFT_978903 [Russula earlei]|uniref:Uncharacterized protein n=1 Tax=Russula earlei TaxID=71964 RepID=A0ACC0UBS1_9AGAM|nr:hypothetical protein F5148DRAFT_978903 [Russula earlei]